MTFWPFKISKLNRSYFYISLHHWDCSLNIKHKALVIQHKMTPSKTCSHFRGSGTACTHVAVFCHLNLQLIFYIKCALSYPPLLLFLPRRKMTCSVAACSIFKSRCNLPTIPDGAECRGWVLDRHIYLTEGEGREPASQEWWKRKYKAHAKGQNLRRRERDWANDAIVTDLIHITAKTASFMCLFRGLWKRVYITVCVVQRWCRDVPWYRADITSCTTGTIDD